MTSAHCYPGVPTDFDITVHGRAYNPDVGGGIEVVDWDCELLLITDNDTDMALFFCDPSANGGKLPGDLHGYADVAWWNPAHDSTDPLYGLYRNVFGNPAVDN